MAVRIPLVTDFDGRGIKKAMAEFKQLESGTDKFAFAMKKALVPAIAVLGGLGAAAASSVKKAIQAQSEQARLETILKTTGLATKEQIKDLNNQAKALGRVGVATGGNITTLQSQLATFDLTGKTIKKLTPAIVDYVVAEKGATASTEDFKSMTNGLAQALQGNFASLTKSGFVLDKQTRKLIASGTETQRANALVKVLNSTYEGFNKTIGETPEGRLVRLRNSIEETQTTIGEKLLPVVETMLRQLQKFATWAENNPAKIMAVSGAIGLVATTVVAVNVAMKIYNALTIVTEALNNKLKTSFTKLQTAMGAIGVLLTAAVGIYALVSKSQDGNRQSTNKLTDALKLETKARQEATTELIKNDKNVRTFYTVLEKLGFTQQQFIQYMKTGKGPIADNAKELKKLAYEAGVSWKDYATFVTTLKNARQDVIDTSNAARLLAGSLGAVGLQATSVSGDLTKFREQLGIGKKESSGFSTAINKVAEETKNLRQAFTSARQGVAEALKSMKKSLQDSLSGAITGAVNFGQIQSAAKDAGVSFMDALGAQVAKARDFAAKLQELMRQSLSPQAIAQVAAAGVDAGTEIANELLAGGAAAINQSNQLVAAAELAAKETGSLAGATYYNEGTVLAQQLTKGITDIVSKYKIKLKSAGLTDKQLQRLQRRFALDVDFVMSGIPALAAGGVVTSPTVALIGEAGPEAVVPLNKMGQMGNVTINVNGGDPQAVVDALRRYMYQNGTVPIRVSG
jgi:hypothetical protein